MFDHITTLTMESKERKVLQEQLRRVLYLIVNNGYCVIAVRINPGIFVRNRHRAEAFLSIPKIQFFAGNNAHEIDRILESISDLKHWHVSKLQFWLGTLDLPKAIQEKNEAKQITVKDLQDNLLINSLQGVIVGGIDPLDGDFNISGVDKLKDILSDGY